MKINFTNSEEQAINFIVANSNNIKKLKPYMLELKETIEPKSFNKILHFLFSRCLNYNLLNCGDFIVNDFLKPDLKIHHEVLQSILNEVAIKNSHHKLNWMRSLFLNGDIIKNEREFFKNYIYKKYKNTQKYSYLQYEKEDESDFLLYFLNHSTKEQKDYLFKEIDKMTTTSQSNIYGLLVLKGLATENIYNRIKNKIQSTHFNELLELIFCFEKNINYIDIFKTELKEKFKKETFDLSKISKIITNDQHRFDYIFDNFISGSNYETFFLNQILINNSNKLDKKKLNLFVNILLEKDKKDSSLNNNSIFILANRIAYSGQKELLEIIFNHTEQYKKDFFPIFRKTILDHSKFCVPSIREEIKINFSQPVMIAFSKFCFHNYLNEISSQIPEPKNEKQKNKI